MTAIRNHRFARRRVAIVLANPSVSSTTGWPVGFWWSELTHPYVAFTEAGYEIEIFSPIGGDCEPDAMSDPRDPSGYSASDIVSMGFLSTPSLLARTRETQPVSAISCDTFDAILVAGGQSPMFTFGEAHDLHRKFSEFFEAGRIAACLCHGSAVLRYAKRTDGTPLALGKTVTGFTNAEEDSADQAVRSYGLLPQDGHIMPWKIEDELRSLGAHFIHVGPWREFAIRDENLITGQQNFSGAATARLIIEALGK